jgi:hypothetical protein
LKLIEQGYKVGYIKPIGGVPVKKAKRYTTLTPCSSRQHSSSRNRWT